MTAVDAILARLLALHPKKIDLSLERMWRILERLDHPERRLPPVVHVGGTNGKGSTVAFMRAILEAAGKRVHVYTSPHLVRMTERFRLAGTLVADEELAATFEECERVNDGEAITVFEITTAAGLLLFSRHAADVLLMEVGLGGRLDATNVVERPLATVVAPIALDHREFLGDTIALIAREKAGIFKPDVPAVIAPQPHEAMRVLEREAQRVRAPLLIAGEQWSVGEERNRLVYQDDAGLLDLPAPRLSGRHQFDNAGLAIATLRAIATLDLPLSAYEKGLGAAEWPARLQRLAAGPLTRLAPEGSEIWLDGGHNPHAGRAVAAALADVEDRVPRPLVVVCGMLANKDVDGFLQHFAGMARRLVAVPIGGQEKAFAPEAIAEAARRAGIQADARASLEEALTRIAQLGIAPPPRILIAGSLYLAGEVLAANATPPV